MRLIHCIGTTATLFVAVILLQGCVNQPGRVPISTFGTWPPHYSVCIRHDQVDLNSIGPELTRVHGDPLCVAQIRVCTWSSPQSRAFDTDVSGVKLWEDVSTHLFSISEQNNIVARARANAAALRPPGTTLYRLTFEKSIVVSSASAASSGAIGVIADYAVCTRIPGVGIPTGTLTEAGGGAPVHD